MARGMPVPTGPALREREVDHRSQHQCRGEGVLVGERIGGRSKRRQVSAFATMRIFL